MHRFALRLGITAALATVSASLLSAQTQFGQTNVFTFGGTGISNSAVVSNADFTSLGVLLGLTATPRCYNDGTEHCGPAITNDGINTFFATPGVGQTSPESTWNFDFAVEGEDFADYTYVLSYSGPGVSGSFDVPLCIPAPPVGEIVCFVGSQDSENLGFTPLISGVFDPTANGQYKFDLDAYDGTDVVGATEMFVDVGNVSVTPEPTTMSLMAFGLVGLAGATVRRRRRK